MIAPGGSIPRVLAALFLALTLGCSGDADPDRTAPSTERSPDGNAFCDVLLEIGTDAGVILNGAYDTAALSDRERRLGFVKLSLDRRDEAMSLAPDEIRDELAEVLDYFANSIEAGDDLTALNVVDRTAPASASTVQSDALFKLGVFQQTRCGLAPA